MINESFDKIIKIAEREFGDVVISSKVFSYKIRFNLIDGSFVDASIPSRKFARRFSLHWERSHLEGKFYRYDNFPNTKWKKIGTYPYHFHAGSQNKVVESKFRRSLVNGFVDFMFFVRARLKKMK